MSRYFVLRWIIAAAGVSTVLASTCTVRPLGSGRDDTDQVRRLRSGLRR